MQVPAITRVEEDPTCRTWTARGQFFKHLLLTTSSKILIMKNSVSVTGILCFSNIGLNISKPKWTKP